MRPTIAEIDLDAIAFNLQGIRKKVAPAGIMAVVKADAYGHGAVQVSQTALRNGACCLGVALVEEAIELRQAEIQAPILVFGGMRPEDAPLFVQYQLQATVYETKAILALEKAAKEQNRPVDVHVKIDTGMGRVGVDWRKALPLIERIARSEAVRLAGVYTHFATSDMIDKSYAHLQLARFRHLLDQLQARHINVPLKHTANSGAILDLPESYFDLVRPGVMMYGHYPSKETSESIPLKPAMKFKTQVLHIKQISRGDSVSYGRKFIASEDTFIATLPVGYADGYNRLLSGQGKVLIRGKVYPVVGRVCMDLIMVDVGRKPSVRVGDEAVLFGRQGRNQISVQSLCDLLHTIPYEVTCWVSKRVPRVYIEKKKRP